MLETLTLPSFFIRFCYSCDIKFVFNYYLREKAEREAAEREKQQVEESDDGVVVSKVRYLESSSLPSQVLKPLFLVINKRGLV